MPRSQIKKLELRSATVHSFIALADLLLILFDISLAILFI
jgi:hypothetical protein